MTKAELAAAHGTPAEFERAVWNAWDMLTPHEQRAAIEAYRARWEAAE